MYLVIGSPCLYISGCIFSIWECVSATQDGREWWSRIERVAVSALAWFDQFPQTTPSARARCPRCELARRVFVLIQYQGKPVSPYSLIAMNIYVRQNIANTWFKVWKCCSKHTPSDSIPVKITLTFPFISANWCTNLIEVWLISNQGCKSKYAFANRCKFLPVLFCC